MITNLAIIVFVIFMAGYWVREGLLSALLHLVAVILSGAIALALWEPIAFMLLGMGNIATMVAWSVALLLPFGVCLLLMRFAIDILVPGNVTVPQIANLIGGAFAGIASAILTSGLFLIGIGFLPMTPSIAGYEPYIVQADGRVEPSGQGLWIPVTSLTNSFYQTLAGGSFHPVLGTSLADASPMIDDQAGQFRLGRTYDQYASLVAPPSTVAVTGVAAVNLPASGAALPESVVDALSQSTRLSLNDPNQKLIAVELDFNNDTPGLFDTDTTLRLPPAQVRLSGYGADDLGLQPIAFSTQDVSQPDIRNFEVIEDNSQVAYAFPTAGKVVMVFVAPKDDENIDFIRVRQLRVPVDMPDPITPDTARRLVDMIGVPSESRSVFDHNTGNASNSDQGTPAGDQTGTNPGARANFVKQSNDLPRMFSKNAATGLSYTDDEPAAVTGGTDTIDDLGSRMGRRNRVASIDGPRHLVTVRVEIQRNQLSSLLSAARAAAAGIGGVWLEDNRGGGQDSRHYPFAFVLEQGEKMIVSISPQGSTFRSASQLPINQMGADDELYLYFLVPPGVDLTSFHIGETSQPIQLRTAIRD